MKIALIVTGVFAVAVSGVLVALAVAARAKAQAAAADDPLELAPLT